ncbi:MAG: 50S ribosomal protein L7/L12 [candidate division WOR-3 bacterium]
MSTKVEELVSMIENLSVKELHNLVQALKEKFGITGSVFMPQTAGPIVQQPTTEAKEEKTEFNVSLVSVGDKKIQVLKELRALTNLGLKEAKDLIDNIPSIIKQGVSKEEAEKIKAKLEEVGAKVEVK